MKRPGALAHQSSTCQSLYDSASARASCLSSTRPHSSPQKPVMVAKHIEPRMPLAFMSSTRAFTS